MCYVRRYPRWIEHERIHAMESARPKPVKSYIAFVLALSFPPAAMPLPTPTQNLASNGLIPHARVSICIDNQRKAAKISSVVSMGDVFVILSLLYFGPGPTLVMYWIDMAVPHLSDVFAITARVFVARSFTPVPFQLSCCALCVFAMENRGNVTTILPSGRNFTPCSRLPR